MAKQEAKKFPGDTDSELLTKPLSLDALKEYGALEEFAPPEGGFDPTGCGTHSYWCWRAKNRWSQHGGLLEIKRGPAAKDGTFDLEVNRTLLLKSCSGLHATAVKMRCASDVLATPKSWELQAETLDIHGKPFALARVEESASVKEGEIAGKRNNRAFKRSIPMPFTSDFSLLDAVQRLPGAETKPMEFALLQGMDELKEAHTLSYREQVSFAVGGKVLALHCYQQIGRGISPCRYYVDEQGRLLLIIGSVFAYIHDPLVRDRHKKAVDGVIWTEEKRKKG